MRKLARRQRHHLFMLSTTYTYISRPTLISNRLGRTEFSLVPGYISLRCQVRGFITKLRGPCRPTSCHRSKNSEIAAIQDHCEANKKTKCLSMEKPNRKGMEQLSVGKWNHTNIPYAPPSVVGCQVPLSAKQEHNIIQREDSWSLLTTVMEAQQPTAGCRPLRLRYRAYMGLPAKTLPSQIVFPQI